MHWNIWAPLDSGRKTKPGTGGRRRPGPKSDHSDKARTVLIYQHQTTGAFNLYTPFSLFALKCPSQRAFKVNSLGKLEIPCQKAYLGKDPKGMEPRKMAWNIWACRFRMVQWDPFGFSHGRWSKLPFACSLGFPEPLLQCTLSKEQKGWARGAQSPEQWALSSAGKSTTQHVELLALH